MPANAIRFTHESDGRLTGVKEPEADTAFYGWDAVGDPALPASAIRSILFVHWLDLPDAARVDGGSSARERQFRHAGAALSLLGNRVDGRGD